MMEKTHISTVAKPKPLPQEKYEAIEKVAFFIEQNRVKELYDLLLEDGQYSLPGKLHSNPANKSEFIERLNKGVNYYFDIIQKPLTHQYSICDFCAIGQIVIQFNACLFKEAMPKRFTSFRFTTNNGYIRSMAICNGDIESRTDYEKRLESLEELKERSFNPVADDLEGNKKVLAILEEGLTHLKKGYWEHVKSALLNLHALTKNWEWDEVISIDYVPELFQDIDEFESDLEGLEINLNEAIEKIKEKIQSMK